MEMEMAVETRLYHGVAPWYNTPCALIVQLVWKVCDLTLGLFYQGDKPPYYDRDAGEEICPRLFSAMQSFVVEELAPRSLTYGGPMRGGAEQTPLFLSKEKECVLDLLIGCGGLGKGSTQLGHHCLYVEADFVLYKVSEQFSLGSAYAVGFILDIAASALHGLIFAFSELVFIRLLGRESTHVILEQQTMVSFFGFVFTSIGVLKNGDFSAMKSESKRFVLGPTAYFMVIIWSAISYQVGVLGSVAILYCASTLLAGVLNSVRVPITSIAAVIFLDDPMNGFKVLSLFLTAWGFVSYVYG
ncbi:hypothetical protein L7F22_006237 [Adiantum nelumboides]|nr:hypothetical protein [Adiantum nelumboides]